ncbi:hypothetical protein [Edaphobacter modestus]|uniref:hypothetical protein n=1 Tax=Edaphobacter modestus TaxID=388466 RepID=UPI0013EE8867|nr:hypothetical protein [Edaphobacter modestus]
MVRKSPARHQFAIRQIVKNPGFAAVTILVLALGIGASASIFSVADAVLFRPLPYPNPKQIVRVWEQMPNGHLTNLAESNLNISSHRTTRSRTWPPMTTRQPLFPAAASRHV